ncbi:glycosyltransferase [Dactylosporangium vinaceum]|uniref:Glycosyltransferase family 2 protein n=1 Tax=Dactylosporangium vinaceum TaxID=53362 RepID=A0ABV5MEK8_9ACTN|nr:glycosyltransferase [Dactylosporangium vinaceum]UAB92365.1 glycosyltransferase [Dactylosporangium vinaceum]
MSVSIVVPTLGRSTLRALLDALGSLPPEVELLVVEDEGRHGPAAARNRGWRSASGDWVVFLDDDVVPAADWYRRLLHDLDVADDVGAVQGRIRVPRPHGRRPTDWERATIGLEDGAWLTADIAYRRKALDEVGGFDERFPRAFREDAELAYRVRRAGWRLVRGGRTVTHPVRPESRWVSLRTQRGNADDALLRRLYGPRWRRLLQIPPGRRGRHALITAAAAGALAAAALPGRRRWLSAVALLGWAAGTAEFAAARIAPGPRDPAEVATMAVTSILIPPLAVGHWLAGAWRWRAA